MNVFDLIDPSFSCRLVTTLMHFLWQGCLVALLAVIGNWLLSLTSASRRYALHVATLAIMVACVQITFSLIEAPVVEHAPAAEPISTATISDPDDFAHENVDRDLIPSMAPNEFADIAPPLSDVSTTADEVEAPAPLVVHAERPTQADANPPRELSRWAPQIAALYFACCGLLLCRLIHGAWGAHRLRRSATIVSEDSLLGILQRQSKMLGLRVLPRIAWCANVSIPLVIGVLRPMILLPAAATTGLSQEQLQALITHELAHIQRHDLVVNLVQRVVESMLFFHPAVWFISRRISNEREQACDELVLATGCERVRYADALVRMAELSSSLRSSGKSAPATSLAAAGDNSSEFKRRVLKVLSVPATSQLRPGRIALLAIATLIVVAAASASRLYLNVFAATPPSTASDSPSAERGSPDPALDPTAGLRNSDEDTNPTNDANVDQPSKPTAESEDPRQAQETTSPSKGLEFLKAYPKLHGLSLDMTEPQFLEIVKQQELKTRKTVDGEKVTHHFALGDGHSLIVMFDKDAKCSGIQRVRGDVDVPAGPKGPLQNEKRVVERSIEFLKKQQLENGQWPELDSLPGGTTSLALCALLQAGVPASDPAIQNGLKALRGVEPQRVYVVSLQTIAFCLADPKGDAELIRRNVQWLQDAQNSASGGLRYHLQKQGAGVTADKGDGSNSRFAVLALHQAAESGFEVPARTWQLVRNFWIDGRVKDGGWGYVPGVNSTPTMTCSGIASLAIVHRNSEPKDNAALAKDEAIRGGLAWLTNRVLPAPSSPWFFYHAHCVERAAHLNRVDRIGEVDWRAELVAEMLKRQQLDGSFGGDARAESRLIATSFALMTLSGRPSVEEPVNAKGLGFLKPYPKLHGLSLDMTEAQFLEIVKRQELKTRRTVEGEKVTHHIGLGDGHTLIVMFDKDSKCSGIQRVRGEDARDTDDSRILITYEIPGAEAETRVFVEHASRGTEAVSAESPLKNGNTLDRNGLAAGDYNVARSRSFEIARGESGAVRSGVFLEYQRFKLEPGQTKAIDFTRSGARPATGRVVGWKNLGIDVLVAYICAKTPNDPRDFNGRDVTTFDARNCDSDGSFRTEPLAPGEYIVVVQGFEPLPRQAQDRTGDILPRFVGTAKLTIPAAAEPQPVEVTLHDAKQPGVQSLPKPAVLFPDHWSVMSVGFDNDDTELVTASTQGFVTIRRWDVVGKKLLSEIKLEGDKPGRGFREGTLMFSGDRRRVIAATDEYVGIWETATGKLLTKLPIPRVGDNDTVRRLGCTQDLSVVVGHLEMNYYLETLIFDAHAVVWDGNTGKQLRTLTLKDQSHLTAISLSSDGKRFATTNGGGATIWDTSTGQQLLQVTNDNKVRKDTDPAGIYSNHVWSIQLSPDGKQLAMGDTLGVKLIDATSGKLLQQLKGPYSYSSGPSSRLVFSKDGQLLARLGTGDKVDGKNTGYIVPIWSTQTGQKRFELHTNANDGEFTDNNQLFAVGFSDRQLGLSVWPLNGDVLEQTAGPGPTSLQDKVEENGHYRGQKAAESIDKFQPTWGNTTLGLQYGIALTKPQPQRKFRSGERVPLVVFFRNISDKPLKLDMTPDFFGSTPKVLNAKRTAIGIEKLILLGTNPHYVENLKPGEAVGPFYLNFGLGENPRPGQQNWHPYFKTPVAGKYALTHSVSINVSDQKDGAPAKRSDIETGTIEFEIADGDKPAPNAQADKPVAVSLTAAELGTLTGRFVYDGVAPVPQDLYSGFAYEPAELAPGQRGSGVAMTYRNFLSAKIRPSTTDPSLLVGKEGGIANVIVWVVSKDIPWTTPQDGLKAATIRVKDGNYVPRITAVTVGQPLHIENHDPVSFIFPDTNGFHVRFV